MSSIHDKGKLYNLERLPIIIVKALFVVCFAMLATGGLEKGYACNSISFLNAAALTALVYLVEPFLTKHEWMRCACYKKCRNLNDDLAHEVDNKGRNVRDWSMLIALLIPWILTIPSLIFLWNSDAKECPMSPYHTFVTTSLWFVVYSFHILLAFFFAKCRYKKYANIEDYNPNSRLPS